MGPVLLLPFVHSVACVHSEEWGYSLRRITWAGGTFQSASFSEGQGWVVTFVTRVTCVTCVWRGYARQCKKSLARMSPFGHRWTLMVRTSVQEESLWHSDFIVARCLGAAHPSTALLER